MEVYTIYITIFEKTIPASTPKYFPIYTFTEDEKIEVMTEAGFEGYKLIFESQLIFTPETQRLISSFAKKVSTVLEDAKRTGIFDVKRLEMLLAPN